MYWKNRVEAKLLAPTSLQEGPLVATTGRKGTLLIAMVVQQPMPNLHSDFSATASGILISLEEWVRKCLMQLELNYLSFGFAILLKYQDEDFGYSDFVSSSGTITKMLQ